MDLPSVLCLKTLLIGLHKTLILDAFLNISLSVTNVLSLKDICNELSNHLNLLEFCHVYTYSVITSKIERIVYLLDPSVDKLFYMIHSDHISFSVEQHKNKLNVYEFDFDGLKKELLKIINLNYLQDKLLKFFYNT